VTAQSTSPEAFRTTNVEVIADAAAYAFDDVTPDFVAKPLNQQGVADVLREAYRQDVTVFPRGGGSQMAYGMPPERGGVVLDMRGVAGLVEYEPADLTVTVEAGMTLEHLQSVLGEQGQWLPLDPPCAAVATIGGLLATNASGPVRHSKGTARDLVIGMQFVTAEGALVKSGGRVVKNVAGYDLAKLHIGALGTLGVTTQVTFKVSPLPAATLNLVVSANDVTKIESLTKTLAATQLPVQGLALVFRAGDGWSLNARFAGGGAAVSRSQSEVSQLCAMSGVVLTEATDDEWDALLKPLQAGSVVRASVSQSKLYSLLAAFAEVASFVAAYPSAGVTYVVLKDGASAQDVTSLRKRCVYAGGALVIERGPLDLRRSAGAWGEPRGDFALMQSLKAEFDPKRLLNPGRFVGGL
jgi:glycolate oxidase FAD binding subunit